MNKQWHHDRIDQYMEKAQHPTLRFDLVIKTACSECDGQGQVLDAPVIGGGTYWDPCIDCKGTGTVDTRIKGLERPFSAFTVGDLTDRAKDVEAYLSRILGLAVRIETGEE